MLPPSYRYPGRFQSGVCTSTHPLPPTSCPFSPGRPLSPPPRLQVPSLQIPNPGVHPGRARRPLLSTVRRATVPPAADEGSRTNGHPGHTKVPSQPSTELHHVPIADCPLPVLRGAQCSRPLGASPIPHPSHLPPLARTAELNKAHADRQDPAAAAEPPSARKQRSLVPGARAARPLAASL